ncbi:replication factor A subunit protein [Martiniozyma asiatica (nom. inval.)]|nr:replication factor A subunit protein [Martiniozyma asiatica]
MSKLESGTLYKLFHEPENAQAFYVQLIQFKHLAEEGALWKAKASDGEWEVNAVIKESFTGTLRKYSILRVTKFGYQSMNGRLYLIIYDGEDCHDGDAPTHPMKSLTNYFQNAPQELKVNFDNTNFADFKTFPKLGLNGSKQSLSNNPKSNQFSNSTGSAPPTKFKNLIGIDALSPYQSTWSIRARVSYKSDMREWSNQRGKGKLFSVNLLDETGQIKATAFNDNASKFYDIFKENKVYYLTKANITQAKKQFSDLDNDYEIQLDRMTEVDEADDSGVPKVQFNFMKLDQLQNTENNTIVDVLGVLKSVGESREIIAKSSGKPYQRRDISVVDETGFECTIGLWGKLAREFTYEPATPLAIKGCKVNDFNGKQLSLIPSGNLIANPDLPEAYKLKGWYDNEGSTSKFSSVKPTSGGNRDLNSHENMTQRKTISEIEAEGAGSDGQQAYYTTKVTPTYFSADKTFAYPACGSDGCSKKVVQQKDGDWRCEKCNVNFPEPDWRYVASISAVDSTGQIWLSMFNEQGEQFFGISAKEMMDMRNSGTNDLKDHLTKNVLFKEIVCRVRASMDSYNGVDRVRYSMVSLAKPDYAAEANFLAETLEKAGL